MSSLDGDCEGLDPRAKQVEAVRRARVLAASATALAILFAIWPALASGFGKDAAAYDPIVALTSLTAVGLIWYTYFTYQTLDHARRSALELSERIEADRTRQRQSLATAVLAELQVVCARLETIRSQGPTTAPEIIAHPMLERALVDPSFWSPETVQALTSTLRHLGDVQIMLEAYPSLASAVENYQVTSGKDRQHMENTRVAAYLGGKTRASWAFNAVVRLVERLRVEGGLLPTRPMEAARALFDHPPLLPNPFDESPQ